MEQRINVFEKGLAAMKSLYGVGGYLAKSSVEKPLLNLIYFRVSQINGCAYCLDMHSKDLRATGETEQRLYGLSAWRETPYFSEREQAALSWAESVTNLKEGNVSDEVYYLVRKQFSEEELIDLTLAVTTINTYNRINIAFRVIPGDYKPGQYK
ncbi:carboxymuconolactone decarboxylase family protein [Chitinophaga sp. SYP-B3965]|uniref:carboxymuconolactone decarboxylase family protein n=1 Tax=Chitinophaga sp. SYP-B3965 TaxID=2663120 RepID=UPI001299AA02|nr:carboxymuconolactone decarboxylase family protein [Chitinophaga sp. SYP-B3965]MRG48433.1 carboxymuconolactone decarboxylase family protein [Chitinophaga sp. SYP-B3965]